VLTLRQIETARERISPCVRRTPLVASATLSEMLGTNVYAKLELLQKTGSFKVRGAFNKARCLPAGAGKKGMVAVSGGNHGQAVAYVARTLGMKSLVIMPEGTPTNYVEATRGYGAEVRFAANAQVAFEQVADFEKKGWSFVHPFDDEDVMAGQGTLALEILEDVPQLTDVIVSVGGGGLATGVATALKSINPAIRIWGVETKGADCMSRSLAAGRIVTLEKITSVARTLGAPAPSKSTYAGVRKLLEGVTVVTDAEAMKALRFLLERLKVLTEPAASCTLAAAEQLKKNFSPDHHVALVLCGGNMAVDALTAA
jgi:threonine dehydratase